jgi:hypothetical protein
MWLLGHMASSSGMLVNQSMGVALLPSGGADDASSPLLATPDGRVAVVGDCLAGSEVQRCVEQAYATARILCETLTSDAS